MRIWRWNPSFRCHIVSTSVVVVPPRQGGARRRELHFPAYQRLNLALITFPAVLLAVHAYHITEVRPVVELIAAAACGMTAAVPAYFYAMSLPEAFRMTTLIKVSG